MAGNEKPTAEQVAQGKARAGGQTATSSQLVDKVSPQAKNAGSTVPAGKSGKVGLLGVPVGTEIVVGMEGSAPPTTSTGRPVTGQTVTKTVRYAAGDGMKYLLSLSNPDRAVLLAKLSEVVGAYPKGQAPTLQFISNALKTGNVAIREEDGKALEQIMKYADTIGESVTISLEKLRNNPTFAQQFFAIKTTIPKAPKLTPEATLNLEITQALNDYLDIPVDKKLAKEFVDTVNNIERKRGTYISAPERNQLLLDAVQKKAGEIFKGTQAPDSLLMQRGALGGSYNALRKAYDAYGIPVDDKTVYKQAINSIRSRQALENEVQKISIQAQVSYPALAPYFQQGLTTRDALATYIGIRSNLFDIPEKDVKISDLYPVFKGKELMTPQEWEDYQYTTPEYKKSRRYIGQVFSDVKTLIRNFVPGGM